MGNKGREIVCMREKEEACIGVYLCVCKRGEDTRYSFRKCDKRENESRAEKKRIEKEV